MDKQRAGNGVSELMVGWAAVAIVSSAAVVVVYTSVVVFVWSHFCFF